MMRLHNFYRRSFPNAAVVIYVAGIIVFILSLSGKFSLSGMSGGMHVVIMLLAVYAGVGFVTSRRSVSFDGMTDKVAYFTAAFQLSISAGLHLFSAAAGSNEWMALFPAETGYAAIVGFGALGLYSVKLSGQMRERYGFEMEAGDERESRKLP